MMTNLEYISGTLGEQAVVDFLECIDCELCSANEPCSQYLDGGKGVFDKTSWLLQEAKDVDVDRLFLTRLVEKWNSALKSGENLTTDDVAKDLSLPVASFFPGAGETAEGEPEDCVERLRWIAKDFNDRIGRMHEMVSLPELLDLLAMATPEQQKLVWFDRTGMHVSDADE